MTGLGDWAGKHLGYDFSDPDLLERALTHKSRSPANNERLEFLGDAVLGLVIADELYQAEPDADEGHLSRLRSRLVRKDTLADVAGNMSVGDILRLGGGEARSGGHQRRSLMADALEALYGAIYIDGGYAAARRVILQHYAPWLEHLPDVEELKDPKTLLQEALQSEGMGLPQYVVTRESGPPHDRHFEVRCVIDERGIDVAGDGRSRRRAEQRAAKLALVRLADSSHAS